MIKAAIHRLGSLAVILAACILAPSSALTCSLPRDWSAEKDFAEAKYVLEALVTEANFIEIKDATATDDFKGIGMVAIRVKPLDNLKGKVTADSVFVTNNLMWGVCGGTPIVVGRTYALTIFDVTDETLALSPEVKARLPRIDGIIGTISSAMLDGSQTSEEFRVKLRSLAKR